MLFYGQCLFTTAGQCKFVTVATRGLGLRVEKKLFRGLQMKGILLFPTGNRSCRCNGVWLALLHYYRNRIGLGALPRSRFFLRDGLRERSNQLFCSCLSCILQ